MPLWLVLLIAAPFVGSFLGVVILREADFARIASGRSHCDSCGATLRSLDLIPLASFFAFRRRCRHCGAELSLFYPAIEFAALAPVAWAATLQNGWLLFLSAMFGWMLIALAWIDWRTFRLPDSLTLPLLALGLGSAALYDPGKWMDHALGAGGSFVVFAALAFGYRRLRGREGLGLGDAKLAAALGAFVSWQGMPATVLVGATLALLMVVIRAVVGTPVARAEQIAFGPFLAAGAWIIWLYGPLLPGWQ